MKQRLNTTNLVIQRKYKKNIKNNKPRNTEKYKTKFNYNKPRNTEKV